MTTGLVFLWIAFLLISTRAAALVERVGQPAVRGELFVGILLGNLSLAGLNFVEPLRHDLVFGFLSELGRLGSIEAKIVLGAAAIDDILGLVIFAVIKAIVESGNIHCQGILWIAFKAVLFIGAAIIMVVLSTIVVPPVLNFLLTSRQKHGGQSAPHS